MKAPLLEMTAEIVIAHASGSPLTKEELLDTINEVYATLEGLAKGEKVTIPKTEAAPKVKGKRGRPPKRSWKKNPLSLLNP
jgi:predicted transcriptional regulator